MTISEIRKQFKVWLESKGFVRTSNINLFIKDQGFYLIVAELQPHKPLGGFFFNLGVKFLWSESDAISYDYSSGDTRVYGQEKPTNPLGAILYDSSTIDEEIRYMMSEANKRIDEYMVLSDMQVLVDRLSTRKDFVAMANSGFEKRDVSLGIALTMCGRGAEAKEIFNNASEHNSVAVALSQSCLEQERFVQDLVRIINSLRTKLSAKLKVKLDEIHIG